MGEKGWFWLIGAKIVCCGALLLLVLTGVLSLGAIGAFLSGNALPLAGAGVVLAVLMAGRGLRMRLSRRSNSAGGGR